MHHSQKIRTLLACIDDLTKAVQEMSNDTKLHQADQDLLLYRSRLFYEAVLSMPTESAAALAPAPASAPTAASTTEHAPASDLQQVEAAIISEMEKAYEAAKTGHQEVEVDLEISVSDDEVLVQTETTAEAAESVVVMEVPEAESSAGEGAEVEAVEASPAEAPTATSEVAEHPKQEEQAAAASHPATDETPMVSPAPSPAPAAVAAPPAAPAAKSSMAFSLTGIIERSGDSHLVMAHLKLKPIDDLKSGIGLNEKFLFIRELFGNDHLAYADAIEKLNAAPSLESAEEILASEVLPKQQWDLETEAALSFLHLIFRRFAQQG